MYLADDDVFSNCQLETLDSFDGERQSLDAPSGLTRPREPHSERVDDLWIGRHLPALPAAAQGLCRVDQTGNDARDARFDGDDEVAGVRATVTDVHRAVAVLLCTDTHNTKCDRQTDRQTQRQGSTSCK